MKKAISALLALAFLSGSVIAAPANAVSLGSSPEYLINSYRLMDAEETEFLTYSGNDCPYEFQYYYFTKSPDPEYPYKMVGVESFEWTARFTFDGITEEALAEQAAAAFDASCQINYYPDSTSSEIGMTVSLPYTPDADFMERSASFAAALKEEGVTVSQATAYVHAKQKWLGTTDFAHVAIYYNLHEDHEEPEVFNLVSAYIKENDLPWQIMEGMGYFYVDTVGEPADAEQQLAIAQQIYRDLGLQVTYSLPESSGASLDSESWNLLAGTGDVSCDGILDLSDAVLMAKLLNEDSSANITAQGRTLADYNGDSLLTITDLKLLLQQITA